MSDSHYLAAFQAQGNPARLLANTRETPAQPPSPLSPPPLEKAAPRQAFPLILPPHAVAGPRSAMLGAAAPPEAAAFFTRPSGAAAYVFKTGDKARLLEAASARLAASLGV